MENKILIKSKKIFSIHLNSNKPENFENFCHALINNMDNPDSLEILVHIDTDDKKMIDVIEKINLSNSNLISYIESKLIRDFSHAWKPLNLLLERTSPSVELIACLSDDLTISTKGWDSILLNYICKNESKKIFRIRCSQYKNEIYKNFWECGFKPDFSFYSKKWLDIVGYWNPCVGPDTFQETVSFYLNNYGFSNSYIDNQIHFLGEETLTGLNLYQRIERAKLGYKTFSELVSYKNQTKANFAAYKIANEMSGEDIKYNKINFLKHVAINFYKKINFFHFRGSKSILTSNPIFNLIFIIWCKIDFFDKYLIELIIYFDKKSILQKIITNKKQYIKLKEAIDKSEHES